MGEDWKNGKMQLGKAKTDNPLFGGERRITRKHKKEEEREETKKSGKK